MVYSEKQILENLDEGAKDIAVFYQLKCINYRGKSNEGKYYTEIISEWCLRHLDLFENIEAIKREQNYKIKPHENPQKTYTNRKEENLAKEMLLKGELKKVGQILDYQVPIKAHRQDKAGKIDLLALDRENKCLRILELKKPDSPETLLRCVLESFTYLKLVDREKLKDEYKEYIPAEIRNCTEVIANPLVADKGKQIDEYRAIDKPKLHELMMKWNIKPLEYKESDFFGDKCTAWD